MPEHDAGRRAAALAAAGLVALNWPVLAVLDRDSTVLGVPLVWLAVFVIWAALIGLLARVMRET